MKRSHYRNIGTILIVFNIVCALTLGSVIEESRIGTYDAVYNTVDEELITNSGSTYRWEVFSDMVTKVPITHRFDNSSNATEDELFFAGNLNDITGLQSTSGSDNNLWNLFNKLDDGKNEIIYTKVGDARPVLARFRYVVVPVWYEDTSDPEKQIDVDQIKSVMDYCTTYYERMSFGKFIFEEPLILDQEVIPVSSVNPGWGSLETAARNRLDDEGYTKDIDYDGIVILYNVAQGGPFSGHGGWGTVNAGETSITWMSWRWGLSNDVARHEFGHNFGHPHHLTNKYLYRVGQEGTVGYDGYDMMSGGNAFDISDFAVASKWYFGWIPDSSIIIMQPDGSSANCPSCVNEGTFILHPLDSDDPSKLMGVHIPITSQGSTLYSYWLSYRSGNPAKIGLSVHISWFGNIGNGQFGAYYDSLNYDAHGDTETREDSFVIPGTCYRISPSMKMLEIDPLSSISISPLVCVDELSEGDFITIRVSFPDLSSLTDATAIRENDYNDINIECGTSIDVNVDSGKSTLLHVKNTGVNGIVNLDICPQSKTAKAYIYDRYPYSPVVYSSPGGYGAQKGLNVKAQCSDSNIEYTTIHNEAYVLIEGTSAVNKKTRLVASCDVNECQYGQKKEGGKCVPCEVNENNCVRCPGGLYFLISACLLVESYKEIESSKKWRIWAPEYHTEKGWNWDVNDLKFYGSTDCNDIIFNNGTPIDSGHAGGGWGPRNAFDSSNNSAWGGRSDADKLFWVGMEFLDSKRVKCVSFLDRSGSGVTQLRVQAWESGSNTWQNVMIEKNHQPGERRNISLEYVSTTAPTGSPSTTLTPSKSPNTASPTSSPSAGQPMMHIHEVRATSVATSDIKWRPRLLLKVVDSSQKPLEKVSLTVQMKKNGKNKKIKTKCKTNKKGLCRIKLPNIKNEFDAVIISFVRATAAGIIYNGSSNVEYPEGCLLFSTDCPTFTIHAPSRYVVVYSDNCSDHGYSDISDADKCSTAASSLGYDISWGPNGGYRDVVGGCSIRFDTDLFFNAQGVCDPSESVDWWSYTECKCADWMPCFCIA